MQRHDVVLFELREKFASRHIFAVNHVVGSFCVCVANKPPGWWPGGINVLQEFHFPANRSSLNVLGHIDFHTLAQISFSF